MAFCGEDTPCLLLKAEFVLSGQIGQGPDFEDLQDLVLHCTVPCEQVLHACLGVVLCKCVGQDVLQRVCRDTAMYLLSY